MFPAALATYYGETCTAILVGAGLDGGALASRRLGRVAGWAAVALGVANTPATLLALGLALLGRIWATKRLRYALAGVGALALIVGESLARRGTAVATLYISNAGEKTIMPFSGLPGFSYPFLLGLLAILFSFGKGLDLLHAGAVPAADGAVCARWASAAPRSGGSIPRGCSLPPASC